MNPAHREPITIVVQGLTFTIQQPWYQKLDAYYAAHAHPLAVTVFADTIPLARERLEQALRFLTETALQDGPQGRKAFKAYLIEKGIPVLDANPQEGPAGPAEAQATPAAPE